MLQGRHPRLGGVEAGGSGRGGLGLAAQASRSHKVAAPPGALLVGLFCRSRDFHLGGGRPVCAPTTMLNTNPDDVKLPGWGSKTCHSCACQHYPTHAVSALGARHAYRSVAEGNKAFAAKGIQALQFTCYLSQSTGNANPCEKLT